MTSKNAELHNRKKAITKKKLKSKARKRSHKFSHKKIHQKLLSANMVLIYIVMLIIAISISYMYRSVDFTDKVYQKTIVSSASMLAYDKTQIRAAKIVGTINQLTNEIVGFKKAPSSLKSFILKDYKDLKNNCIVNGNLVGQAHYSVINVTVNGFASISKGCNGEQKSILVKFNEQWVNVHSGNSLISCKDVNDYNVPQVISKNCQSNGVIFLNPNP